MPHDHRMWAAIGIYSGREDNIFWRKVPDAPDPSAAALDAELRREIRRSFDEASRDEEHFPATIDKRIQLRQLTPAGARLVYQEARRWFGLYRAEDKLRLFIGGGPHGTPLETRQAIYEYP